MTDKEVNRLRVPAHIGKRLPNPANRSRQLRARLDVAQRRFEKETRNVRSQFQVLVGGTGTKTENFVAWTVQCERLLQAIKEYRDAVDAYIQGGSNSS